jgi:hypothetical protein
MNVDFNLSILGHTFHFYRRRVGTKMVFSLYVDGNSVWELIESRSA